MLDVKVAIYIYIVPSLEINKIIEGTDKLDIYCICEGNNQEQCTRMVDCQ